MGNGNTLQTEISTRVGSTFGVMDQLGSKLVQLGGHQQANTRHANNFQRAHSDAHRTAQNEATMLAMTYRQVGHAISLAGGHLGHFGHLISGGAAIGKHGVALLGLSAGAAAAAATLKVLELIEEDRLDLVKKEIESEHALTDARRRANEEADKRSHGAAKNSGNVRALVGAGGASAYDLAQKLSTEHGIPFEEAVKGLTTIFGSRRLKSSKQKNTAIAASIEAHDAGVPFSESAKTINESSALINLTSTFSNLKSIAAYVLQKQKTGHTAGASVEALDAAKSNIAGVPFLRGAEAAAKTDAQTEAETRARAGAGGAATDAHRERVLNNPAGAVAAEQTEAFRQRERQIELMKAQLDAMGFMGRFLNQFTTMFGRNAEQQLYKKMEDPVVIGKGKD